MVVDVAVPKVQTKLKSCWFPFKKHVENRRINSITYDYDYDGVDFANSREIRSKNSSTENSGHPSLRRRINQHQQNRTTASVSTGTDSSYETHSSSNYDDNSSPAQSNVSQKDNGSHRSYQADYDNDFDFYNFDQTSLLERAFLTRSNDRVLRSPSSMDDDEEDSIMEMSPDGLPTNYPYEGAAEDLFPAQLALVETNCLSKQFWTDEVVDGGALSCLQQRMSGGVTGGGSSRGGRGMACVTIMAQDDDDDNAVEVYVQPGGHIRTAHAPLERQNFKIVQEVNGYISPHPNDMDQQIQKSLQAVYNGGNNTAGIRYLRRDPEDIKQELPLQRAFCQKVQFRKSSGKDKIIPNPKQRDPSTSQISSLSSSHPSPSQNHQVSFSSTSLESSFLTGDRSSSKSYSHNNNDAKVLPPLSSAATRQTSSSPWRQNERKHKTSNVASVNCISEPCSNSPPSLQITPMVEDEQNIPHFYIEVQAMREQLNGIRDLEELQAKDKRLVKDIGVARTASLVDGDSTFMDSVFEDTASSDIISEVQKQPVIATNQHALEGKNKTGWFCKNRHVSASKTHTRLSEDSTRTAQLMHNDPNGKSYNWQQKQQKSSKINLERPKISNSPNEKSTVPDIPDRSRATPLAYMTPNRSEISKTNGSLNRSARDPSNWDTEEQSMSRRVAQRPKTVDDEKQVPRTPETALESRRSDIYDRKREILGSNSPASSETSSTPRPSQSFSPPSTKPRSSFESTSLTSSEISASNPRKLTTSQRSSPGNSRSIPKLSPPRHDTHAAKEAYFGPPKPKELEHAFPASPWQQQNAYVDEPDRSEQCRSQDSTPTFDDGFWKDDYDNDESEIKSEAFQEYDGDDSLFGDLKSTADSNESSESEPSSMSFGNFDENLSTTSSNQDPNYHVQRDDSTSRCSRENQSRYTSEGQSEYTNSEVSPYTTERSRYTSCDESGDTPADVSRDTAGDQSRYTTDYSRCSRSGETSNVSKGTVSAFVDENDGELVAAIDKWLTNYY
jgi:hypothetical protein